jgi:hypothetical protein
VAAGGGVLVDVASGDELDGEVSCEPKPAQPNSSTKVLKRKKVNKARSIIFDIAHLAMTIEPH